jgi:hypothetical protein
MMKANHAGRVAGSTTKKLCWEVVGHVIPRHSRIGSAEMAYG